MKLNHILAFGLLSLGLLACSDDNSSSADSNQDLVDSTKQTITYDGKTVAYAIKDGVSDITLKGIENKKVYFIRANVAEGGENPRAATIGYKSLSYLKGITPASNDTVSTKTASTTQAVKKRFYPSISQFKKTGTSALTKEVLDNHEYTIPTEPLKQLTPADIKVGETKRIFKIPNTRYYDEDLNPLEKPDENYKDDPWIDMEFTARSVGENSIIWVPSSDIDPKTKKEWTCHDDEGINFKAATSTELTQGMLDAIKDKFEAIYPYETDMFGQKSSQIFSKLKDEDDDVAGVEPVDLNRYSDLANFTNILVFDFNAIRCVSDVLGFFDTNDYFPGYDHYGYTSKHAKTATSNEGNFLYINDRAIYDSELYGLRVDPSTNITYQAILTMAHEFMLSLEYARKILEQDSHGWGGSFEEMIGQLCEYALAKKIGIPANADIVAKRYLDFAINYDNAGLLEYGSGMYEMTFALGVFLLHNYGGQALLSDMVQNEYTGWEAIINAIKKVTDKDVTEESLMLQFIEANIYPNSDYAKNMNKKIQFTAKGESIERDGINVFDLTEHGYVTEIPKDLTHLYPIPATSVSNAMKLHPDYGFHIGEIEFLQPTDTGSFQITREGTKSPNEKLYVFIGDKE